MQHLLLSGLKFYKENGLVGVCSRKIWNLRGGADNVGRIPHTEQPAKGSSSTPKTSLTAEQIDDILRDDRISDAQKAPYIALRQDPMYGDGEELQADKLRASLIAKSQHPLYVKIKGKIPFAILSPFTLGELARLSAYRVAGFTSAPLTLPAFIGFSMPCAITFAMLEMYAPDKLKFPCKCAKWAGGVVFYGVSATVDYATAGLETKVFGQPLPIDAPQLMGTLPRQADLDELRKLKALAKSMTEKSNPMPTLSTVADLGEY